MKKSIKLIVIAVVTILFAASCSKQITLPIPPDPIDVGKISWIDSSTIPNGQFQIKPVGVPIPLVSFTSGLNTSGFTNNAKGNYEVIVSPNGIYTSFGVFIYEDGNQIYGSYKPSGQTRFSVDSTKNYKVVFK